MTNTAETLAIDGGSPVRDDFLVFGAPQIEQVEIDEVVDSLKSGWVGTGPKVAAFEKQFAEYVGAEHAVAVSSCTAALHLSLLAAGVGQGDEVITTPLTFAATANAIVHTGATPVFADVDRETQNIEPKAIEQAVTERTKAIIPVHFAGYPCDVAAIASIANDAGAVVIEDAAHCIEGTSGGRHVGSISEATCFSFYVTKNITTIEGGMITTSDPDFAADLKVRALHGMSRDAWERYSSTGFKHYQVVNAGFKYNLTDVQASLGIHQLARIEESLARRQVVWQRYLEGFAGLPVDLPQLPATDRHAHHLFTVFPRLEELSVDRDGILTALQAENIGVGIHYVALHKHPFYQEQFGFTGDEFPSASWLSDRTISLPFSSKLTDDEVDDVIAGLTKVLTHYRT